MEYERLYVGEKIYKMVLGHGGPCPEHRHANFEFHYCVRGERIFMIENKRHTIHAGEILLIPPMESHRALENESADNESMMCIVGPVFLKEAFVPLLYTTFRQVHIPAEQNSTALQEIRTLLNECVERLKNPVKNNDLLLKGNLYKLCAYLLSEFTAPAPITEKNDKDLRKIENIERTLQLIYCNYNKPITTEQAAEEAGYSKSNFCKIFKQVVGESFHTFLNRYRVDCARFLLRDTSVPLAEIAKENGFGEVKTFCRVFKTLTGLTPGAYRKQARF